MSEKIELLNVESRKKIIANIEKYKIITIIRGLRGEKLIETAKALYAGGIRLMEITYDASGKVSDNETGKMLTELIRVLPSDVMIGSGTVTDVGKVEMSRRSGAGFIISPDTNESVIKRTVELGMVSIPGALTPTEICNAHNWGADYVKVFPAGILGSEYIKAIRAPLSHVKLLGVGNIGIEDISEYLNSGLCGIGVGSGIVKKEYIEAGEFDKLAAFVKDFVDSVKKA